MSKKEEVSDLKIRLATTSPYPIRNPRKYPQCQFSGDTYHKFTLCDGDKCERCGLNRDEILDGVRQFVGNQDGPRR